MVIDGSDTTRSNKKLLALWYNIVHHAYAKLVKKRHKRDPLLYSSHSKFEFVEIPIDSKTAETICIFSSYQTLKLDKNLLEKFFSKEAQKKGGAHDCQ